jgi:hypothetical protein
MIRGYIRVFGNAPLSKLGRIAEDEKKRKKLSNG